MIKCDYCDTDCHLLKKFLKNMYTQKMNKHKNMIVL